MSLCMDRSAVAYFTNGKLIFAPIIRTTSGLGLEVDPVALDPTSEGRAYANAISEALDSSTRVVPHPSQDQWKGFFEPFQKAAGVRSHKAFMKDAVRVSIRATDDLFELTPQRNLGTKGGFEEIPEAALILSPGDLDGAARALKDMLALNGS